MKNIDRLFSHALEQHTTTPPAGLWERVESRLPEAKEHARWMRWAAVLVPVLVAAGLAVPRSEESEYVTERAVAEPATFVVEPKYAQQEPVAVSVPRRKQKRLAPVVKQPVATEAPPVPVVVASPEEVVLEEITIEPVVLEVELVAIEKEAPKPIVIEYTLDPLVARKESSLNRVVEFARAVKHSDPISEVRGLKDELFAFDFRKKHTKKN